MPTSNCCFGTADGCRLLISHVQYVSPGRNIHFFFSRLSLSLAVLLLSRKLVTNYFGGIVSNFQFFQREQNITELPPNHSVTHGGGIIHVFWRREERTTHIIISHIYIASSDKPQTYNPSVARTNRLQKHLIYQ